MSYKPDIQSTRHLGFKPAIDPRWMIAPGFGLTLEDVEGICGEIEADLADGEHYDEPIKDWSNTYEIELQLSNGLYPTYLIVEVWHRTRCWRERRYGGYETLTDSESRITKAWIEVDSDGGIQKYNLSPLGLAVLRKAMRL